MHYEYSYALEEGANVLIGLLSGFPVTALNIASYVLASLALYTLAQRRGIKNPWLAWLPVVNCWLIGSLSDQYRYVVKGEIKSKRTVLLVLTIVRAVLNVAEFSCIVAAIPMVLIGDLQAPGLLLAICGLMLALAGVSIGHAVIYFIALNDIFRSMDPENSTLFLVLSIIFNVTEPFFLFFNRNKDLGMPPRREHPPVQEPVWQQPEQEPWEKDNKDYL